VPSAYLWGKDGVETRVINSILLPTLCTYLIKNYHNSHLKTHTLKMSVMHD